MDWQALRDDMPVTRQWAFFDHAAVAPLTAAARRALGAWADDVTALDAVGALCRERGVYFFVDAIQGLGVLPLDVRRTPVDFLAADGHKWLLGPEGAAVFYVRREVLDLLHPVGVGWNSVVGANDFTR